MSNGQIYKKGRRKEYKLCDGLKAEGFDIVQRSAGSHSPIDIFAIHKEKKLILLIQSKIGKYVKKEFAAYNWLNGEFKVKFEVR